MKSLTHVVTTFPVFSNLKFLSNLLLLKNELQSQTVTVEKLKTSALKWHRSEQSHFTSFGFLQFNNLTRKMIVYNSTVYSPLMYMSIFSNRKFLSIQNENLSCSMVVISASNDFYLKSYDQFEFWPCALVFGIK